MSGSADPRDEGADTSEPLADPSPEALAERLTELEREAENDRQARRGESATLISRIQQLTEQLAGLHTDLRELRNLVDPLNDDLDLFAHRISQLEAVLEERKSAPRAGTPIVWHKLNLEVAAALWTSFTEWVVWLADTYAFTVHQFPRCWYLHDGVVYELTALWTSWLSAHDRDKGDAGAAVYLWHDALARALDRCSSKWLGQCVNGSHKPRERTPWSEDPAYLEDFAQLPESITPADPADSGPADPTPEPSSPSPS